MLFRIDKLTLMSITAMEEEIKKLRGDWPGLAKSFRASMEQSINNLSKNMPKDLHEEFVKIHEANYEKLLKKIIALAK
jgi:hypothetical protein